MSMLDRIRDSFKYLDKNGLKHLIEKIKAHDVHWTGTHAEYEAVKDTIPAYAILHFTDDYDENVEVGVYATHETKTGELWVDNKPIYRNVIQFVTSSTGTQTVPVGAPVDTLVSVSGRILTTGAGTPIRRYSMPINWPYEPSSTSPVYTSEYFDYNGTVANSFYIRTSRDYERNKNAFLIVKYTKTTD